jgi:hypothetical protein
MPRIILIVLLFGILFFQFSVEKSPLQEATSGNEQFFMQVAMDFSEVMEKDSYNFWQLTTILPFALLHFTYKFLGFPLQPSALYSGMLILNLLFLVMAVRWFFRIMRQLEFNESLETLAFILVFFNFFILKSVWQMPFTNELAAFAFALGQVHYFINTEKDKLRLFTFIGTFISPFLPLIGLCLLAFSSERLALIGEKKNVTIFSKVLLFFLLLGGLVIGGWLTGKLTGTWSENLGFLLSAGVLAILLYKVISFSPINWARSWQSNRINKPFQSLTFFVLGLLGLSLLLWLLSGNKHSIQLPQLVWKYAEASLRFPFDFLLHHTLFFGLLIPFILLFYKKILKAMALSGFGFTLLMAFTLLIFIHPNSALLVPFVAPLIFVLMRAISMYKVKWKDVWIIGLLNLIISMFWWPFQTSTLGSSLTKETVSNFLNRLSMMYFSGQQDLSMMSLVFMVFLLLLFLLYKGKKRYIRSTGL